MTLKPIFTYLLVVISINFAQLSIAETSHQLNGFSEALASFVNQGQVDYSGFQNNPAFNTYIGHIESTELDTSTSLDEKLAFYINAYNALAIKGILEGRSPKSFFSRVTYFSTSTYQLAGEEINLNDLEHERIRPLKEPRIHFALVCAAQSCPKLRSEAYRAEDLNRQLDENARDFINDPRKNRFDKKNKVAHLSKIFDWFEEDFIAKGDTLQTYIARYVDDPDVAKAMAENSYKIKFLTYDWSLNGEL